VQSFIKFYSKIATVGVMTDRHTHTDRQTPAVL